MKTHGSISRRRPLLRPALAALVLASLAACGGGSESTPATGASAGIATFIDAKVEGLTYRSASHNGVTDKNGNFPYAAGEQVTFSVGDLVLGTVAPTGNKVTPLDLVPGATASDERVIRILRTLQTLDADADPENGIKISPAASDYAHQGTPVQVAASSTSDEAVESRLYTAKFTRTKEQAQTHFEAHKADSSNSALGVSTNSRTNSSTTTASTAQPANLNGRLLASNCYQCHGTMGTGGFDKIRGGEASEVLEYLSKPASGDIMAAHAQGYTRAQLNTIIAYLKQ